MKPDRQKSLLSAAAVIVFTAPAVYFTYDVYRDQIVLAAEWTKRWKSPCDIVRLLKIRQGLFIFTTENCSLEQ